MAGDVSNVVLWDGIPRSESDVRRYAPALLEYHRNHSALSEIVNAPNLAAEGTNSTAVMAVFACTAWLGLAFLLMLFRADRGVATATLLVATLGIGAVHVLGLLSRRIAFPRTIRLENGRLTCIQPTGSRSYSLERLYWFKGYTRSDPLLAGYAERPCIILRPNSAHDALACGFTDEMLTLWSSFLSFAQVPQGRTRRKHGWSYVLLGVIAGMAAAWAVGAYLQPLMPRHLGFACCTYVSIVISVLGGIAGSVLAGGDWFALRRSRACFDLFGVFVSISLFPSAIAGVGLLMSVVCAIASGLLGAIAAWLIGSFEIRALEHERVGEGTLV